MKDESKELLEESIQNWLEIAKDDNLDMRDRFAAHDKAMNAIKELRADESLDVEYAKHQSTLEFEREKFEKQQENELTKTQMEIDQKAEDSKKHFWLQIGLAVFTATCGGVYALFQRGCMRESIDKEMEGYSPTTTAGRSVMKDLFHFKK